MRVISGVVFPESILSSTWFSVLATVVAFNTIIYVGLTLSKFVPWPRQIHPSKIRAIHDVVFNPAARSKSHQPASLIQVTESTEPFDVMRDELARREIPQAFAVFGGLLLIFSIAEILFSDAGASLYQLLTILASVGFLIAAQIFGRRPFRASTLNSAWIIGSLIVFGVLLSGAATEGGVTTTGIVLIYLTGFGSILLRWVPVLVATGIMIAAITIVLLWTGSPLAAQTIFVSFVAGGTGMLLQSIRISSLHRLSDEKQLYSSLATTDPLTGVLSRTGLMSLLPGVASQARRVDQGVCVMMIDIEGLASHNHDYGLAYGDEILRTTADAIRTTVREGDLIARWGEDDFLVGGIGGRPDANSVRSRLEEYIRTTGINLGKRPIVVQVSTAAGDTSAVTFEALLSEAEAHL